MLDNNFISKNSSVLFDEFLNNNEKFKTLSYFRRNPEGYLLMLKIMEYYHLDKDIYVEQLINNIPSNIASRLSVFTLIDQAEKKGLIIKNSCSRDKRRKTIKPSEKFLKEYVDWMQNLINFHLKKTK